MNLEIDDLERQQAICILKKLAWDDSSIASRIQAIIQQIDSAIDENQIADEVFMELDSIQVEDLWHKSGSTRYGYVEPCEKAFEMVEDVINPFSDKLKKYLSKSRWEEAKIFGIGIVRGLHNFEANSQSEFKDWAPDVVDTMVSNILDVWKNNCTNAVLLNEIMQLIDN